MEPDELEYTECILLYSGNLVSVIDVLQAGKGMLREQLLIATVYDVFREEYCRWL